MECGRLGSHRGVDLAGLMIFACSLPASPSYCQDVSQQIADHHLKAQKAAREARYEEAESEYKTVLRMDPSLAEVHANLGMLYFAQSKFAEAAEAYERALEIQPTLNRARLFFGCARFYLGQHDNSIQTLNEALSGQLEDVYRKLGQVHLARNHLALDQTEKAVAVLKPLAQDFPEDPDISYMLGKAYLRLAAAAAEKLGAAGNHPRARQMMAETFINQGKFQEAIEEYRAALALSPESADVHFALGLLLLRDNQIEEGERHLATSSELMPNDERARELLEISRGGKLSKLALEEALSGASRRGGRIATSFIDPVPAVPRTRIRDGEEAEPAFRAQLLYVQGDYEAVAELLKEPAAQKSPDAEVLYWQVKSYQALSVQWLDLIAQVAPDSAAAHLLLAQSFEKQGRDQEALNEYEQVLNKNPRLTGIHYAKGLILMRTQRWEEAERAFRQELEVNPSNAGAFFRLGLLSYRAANFETAEEYFARAVDTDSNFGDARFRLGVILIRKGAFGEAVPHLQAAAQLNPEDHTVHFQLYRAYRGLGQTDLAQKSLETFQRREREIKQATEQKAARSMDRIQKAGKQEASAPHPE